MSRQNKKQSTRLFDRLAPIYDQFYGCQKRGFSLVLDSLYRELDLHHCESVIDVGCGTGALCSLMQQRGLKVTGVDQSEKMLSRARSKPENQSIQFLRANVLEGLPFKDKHFDLSIASYVAHGLTAAERKILYAEMSRVSRHLVIIYDYNRNRSIITDLLEWLEGGDYFNFIRVAEEEFRECFPRLRVQEVGIRSSWYAGYLS